MSYGQDPKGGQWGGQYGQNPGQYGQYGQGQYGQGQYGNPYGAPQTPGYGYGPMPPGSVKTYLVESILLLLFCGGLFAIPAIVYAAQVNSKLQMGDYQGAVASSENAKKWCLIALAIGLTCNVGGFILMMVMGAAGSMQ
jgi:hypothetical protein